MLRLIANRAFLGGIRERNPTVCVAVFRGKSDFVLPAQIDSAKDASQKEAVILDLDDYKKAYAFRKTSEIARALFVFKLCSYQTFVKHSLKLMKLGQTVLGKRLYTKLMTSTFGGQFVGGVTTDELLRTVTSLQKAGIGPLLCIPIEEDVGESEYRSEPYDENLKALLECVSLSKQVDKAFPMSQMKLTSLVPGNICATLSTIVLQAEEDHAYLDNIIRVFDGGDLDLSGLKPADHDALYQALQRVNAIGEHVERSNVRLLVDAEYTYLNPALRLIAVAMMVRYNQQRPLVAYTYQNYLKETFDKFRADETLVRSRGACFGAKIVRGAYMLSEREMAKVEGYPDPVHDSFKDTTDMYHRSVEYLLGKISREPERYFAMVASHNEETVQYILKQLTLKGVSGADGCVVFGQLYGMCDHLTSALSQANNLVYKSIPYGPLESCIPYLSRRAAENSSILGATGRERKLMWRALMGRFGPSCGSKLGT